MSDPRFDQQDPRLSDPVQRYDDVGSNNPWSWIAGLGVLALIIVFLVIGGHNANQQNAGNTSSPAATSGMGTAPRSTTGMGSPTMQPTQPSKPAQPDQPSQNK
jgi:hypothetical protein